MDDHGWSEVIFAWVQKCGFVNENVLTLEQSNINTFFNRYLEYDDMQISLVDTNSKQNLRPVKPLVTFLKNVYPDFRPNLDRSGNLDRTDYLLVYTLMLHYACVIKKSEKYQFKCTKLPQSIQNRIASFLKAIVEVRKITRICLRETLKITMQDTSTSMPSSPTVIRIPFTPGTPDTPKSTAASPHTPTATPSHTSGGQSSPLPICSTPMRERERVTEAEWRQVRDRLAATEIKLAETETKLTSTEGKLATTESEYTFLDDMCQELVESNTKFKTENTEIKGEIRLLREKVKIFEERLTDEDAEGQANYEHFKLGYVRDIAAKEQKIAEARELLQDAINEREKEEKKVRKLEEQLNMCFDQISGLELKVKELIDKLGDKDLEIICLERERHDLTQCLNVLRQESQGRREVLNASSDMLDTSLSPGSVPENLASSVIDKQLREKEQEICQLKEEFEKLQSSIYELLKSKLKIEPPPKSESCLKDQTQLLRAIGDALVIGPQAAAENETQKLFIKIKALRAKLSKEMETMSEMQQMHDREYTRVYNRSEVPDKDLQREENMLEEQQNRIAGLQRMLETLVSAKDKEPKVAEQDFELLHELQKQLEVLQTESSMMSIQKLHTLHSTLNNVEDHRSKLEQAEAQNVKKIKRLEAAHDQLSKKYLEASKRQSAKDALLDEKERELIVLKDQIEQLEQEKQDEKIWVRLHDSLRAEHSKLVNARNTLTIKSREQSRRLMQLAVQLDHLTLEHKEKEAQIKMEHNEPDSEIAHRRVYELNDLENKLNIVMLKRDQAEADASEQADKLAQVLQRIEQIQKETEAHYAAMAQQDAEEQAKNVEAIEDLMAERTSLVAKNDLLDAKVVELSAEIKKLTERVDQLVLERSELEQSLELSNNSEKLLVRERTQLTEIVKEQEVAASKLQRSIVVMSVKKTELEDKLVQLESRLEDADAANELLVANEESEKERIKQFEQELRDVSSRLVQERASQAVQIQELQLEIAKWREDYKTISKESNANKEQANKNESECQKLLQEIAKWRADYETISKESNANKEQANKNESECQKLLQEIAKWRADYETISKESNANKEQANKNESECQKLLQISKDSMAEMRSQIDSLEHKYNESKKKYEELLAERSNRDKQYENERIEVELKLTDCQRKLEDRNDSYELLVKERDTLAQERATLTQERGHLMEERDALTHMRDTLTQERDSLKHERDTLTEAAKQHQVELASLQNKYALATSVTEEKNLLLEQQVLGLRDSASETLALQSSANKENLKKHVEQLQDKMHKELKQKDAQIETLRKDRECLRKSERIAKKELSVLMTNADEKEAQLNQEIGSLNMQLMHTNQRLEQATRQTVTQNGELEQLQMKIAAEAQALEAAKQEQLCLRKELQEQREQMQHLEEAHQMDKLKLEKQAELLQLDLQAFDQEKQQLQANLLQQEDEHLQQLLQCEHQLEESEKKCTFLQIQMADQQKSANERQIQLGQQLANLLQQEDEHKQQLQLCEHQLEEMGKKYACLQIQMTDQQKSADERQMELGQKLAEAMEAVHATYTAAAEEEALPDRSTLQRDCQVLQAKYQEAKKKIDELQVSIKDQRNEMEGKLEKMKNKMRTLYTAEVTRMKEKQEREAAHSKAELEAIICQNTKYEEHTRKLSNQIVRLNEKILEQQKQHAITTTKLRHMHASAEATKSSSSLSTLTVSGSATATATATGGTGATEDWQPFKRPTAPSSNLAMEDEEGEVFNNTYLTDLKLGRVPDITAEELNYRNSLQPPHLRSTYAAQYDVGSQDEDLKDGPHSLDDSMSALLSSSASTGARKKAMGTHYKRPGPPTPSKNGGRLSFGSSEPPREILRETCENTGNSKTPTRFKMFTSRFSIGSSTSGSSGLPRDERPLRRKRPNLLTGMQRRRLQLRQSSGLFCTSTPRKSRSYYDQRRLICASDAVSDQDEIEHEDEEVHEEEREQEQEILAEELEDEEEEGTPHLSNGALLAITRGVTRRLSSDPPHSTPSSGSTPHVSRRKYRNGRVSLCLHGNIFAKSRPLVKISATAHAGNLKNQRKKLKQQRLNRFDQGRHLHDSPVAPTNVTYQLLQPLGCCDNNNYSLHNRNEELQQQQQLLLKMGQTVVLKPEEQILDDGLLPVAAATFNVSESDTSSVWQHQQRFERENIQAWLTEYTRENEMADVDEPDIHGGHFERLCRETESTAPFELQPLHYKTQQQEEEQQQPKVRSVRPINITGTTSVCTSNASCATNLTSASSRKSCTIYSMGNIHSEPLPTVTITHVEQRVVHQEPRRRKLTLRDLWHDFCCLNLSGHLILSLALALIVMLCVCTQVSDRMALGVTAIVTAMGIMLLGVLTQS